MLEALSRAQSYLLVSSIIGNSLTFGLGGELLGAYDEDLRDKFEKTFRDGLLEDLALKGKEKQEG